MKNITIEIYKEETNELVKTIKFNTPTTQNEFAIIYPIIDSEKRFNKYCKVYLTFKKQKQCIYNNKNEKRTSL